MYVHADSSIIQPYLYISRLVSSRLTLTRRLHDVCMENSAHTFPPLFPIIHISLHFLPHDTTRCFQTPMHANSLLHPLRCKLLIHPHDHDHDRRTERKKTTRFTSCIHQRTNDRNAGGKEPASVVISRSPPPPLPLPLLLSFFSLPKNCLAVEYRSLYTSPHTLTHPQPSHHHARRVFKR